jgi:hypothetical protein
MQNQSHRFEPICASQIYLIPPDLIITSRRGEQKMSSSENLRKEWQHKAPAHRCHLGYPRSVSNEINVIILLVPLMFTNMQGIETCFIFWQVWVISTPELGVILIGAHPGKLATRVSNIKHRTCLDLSDYIHRLWNFLLLFRARYSRWRFRCLSSSSRTYHT